MARSKLFDIPSHISPRSGEFLHLPGLFRNLRGFIVEMFRCGGRRARECKSGGKGKRKNPREDEQASFIDWPGILEAEQRDHTPGWLALVYTPVCRVISAAAVRQARGENAREERRRGENYKSWSAGRVHGFAGE